jgi:multidrug efflux pump
LPECFSVLGRLVGAIQADKAISFQLMRQKLEQLIALVRQDPAVDSVVGFTGNTQTNSGFVFASLKPLSERRLSVDQVIGRLRGKLSQIAGARLIFQPVQDIRMGGRQSNALYQYTLQDDSLPELNMWAPKIANQLATLPELTDVNSDQQDRGLETDLVIDRATAARLGLTVEQIDNTLYDAFGQRQVSVMYAQRNQYHVVMEVAPEFWQSPDMLKQIYISTGGETPSGTQTTQAVAGTVIAATVTTNNAATVTTNNAATVTTNNAATVATNNAATMTTNNAVNPVAMASTSPSATSVASDTARNQAMNSLASTGTITASAGTPVSTSVETMIPLSAFTRFGPGTTPLSVNHQGLSVATTISFNLKPGVSLGQAASAIDRTMAQLHVPSSVHASFQGTARAFSSRSIMSRC